MRHQRVESIPFRIGPDYTAQLGAIRGILPHKSTKNAGLLKRAEESGLLVDATSPSAKIRSIILVDQYVWLSSFQSETLVAKWRRLLSKREKESHFADSEIDN